MGFKRQFTITLIVFCISIIRDIVHHKKIKKGDRAIVCHRFPVVLNQHIYFQQLRELRSRKHI